MVESLGEFLVSELGGALVSGVWQRISKAVGSAN